MCAVGTTTTTELAFEYEIAPLLKPEGRRKEGDTEEGEGDNRCGVGKKKEKEMCGHLWSEKGVPATLQKAGK